MNYCIKRVEEALVALAATFSSSALPVLLSPIFLLDLNEVADYSSTWFLPCVLVQMAVYKKHYFFFFSTILKKMITFPWKHPIYFSIHWFNLSQQSIISDLMLPVVVVFHVSHRSTKSSSNQVCFYRGYFYGFVNDLISPTITVASNTGEIWCSNAGAEHHFGQYYISYH